MSNSTHKVEVFKVKDVEPCPNADNMNTFYQLPKGSGFGWGVCGENLGAALAMEGCYEFPTTPYPQIVDGDIIEAMEGSSLLPVSKFNYVDCHHLQHLLGFVEDNILAEKYKLNISQYNGIICGCTNMMNELLEFLPKGYPVSVAIQGVDQSKFYFDRNFVRPEWARDKFVVGSFGKFEYRKGQDIVIEAFNKFSQGKRDVVLAYNWSNLWPQSVNTMRHSPYLSDEAKRNLSACAGTNHIDAALFYGGLVKKETVSFPFVPHSDPHYADMYRCCNVTLFPNRKEAGTNLPLMESMACGVPPITVDTHGHADVTDGVCEISSKPFVHKVGDVELGTYYEPSVDDCVDKLNWDYKNRSGCNETCSKLMEDFTWRAMAYQCLNSLNY